MVTAAKVTIEEAAPVHPISALMINLHRTIPTAPSGYWIEESLLNSIFGVINVAYSMSATARFKSK